MERLGGRVPLHWESLKTDERSLELLLQGDL